MRNASALHIAEAHVAVPAGSPAAEAAPRPRLTLVPPPTPAPPAPARQRLAALIAGLMSGFVLAAIAALLGGGSPRGALTAVAVLAVPLAVVLVHARATTVRARRRRRTDRSVRAEVIAIDSARAA